MMGAVAQEEVTLFWRLFHSPKGSWSQLSRLRFQEVLSEASSPLPWAISTGAWKWVCCKDCP